MIDETQFRRVAESELEKLKQLLIEAEEDGGFEVEENGGVLKVDFEDGSRFVYTPNTPVRQIWISAMVSSFKLDWDETANMFVLPKTGEGLVKLTERLVREHTGEESISLG